MTKRKTDLRARLGEKMWIARCTMFPKVYKYHCVASSARVRFASPRRTKRYFAEHFWKKEN